MSEKNWTNLEFTPGEWTVRRETDDTEFGLWDFLIIETPEGKQIAHMIPFGNTVTEESKANAALCKVAPKMYHYLDKLKNLFITFSWRNLRCNQKKDAERWMEKAMEIEALLKEARGES